MTVNALDYILGFLCYVAAVLVLMSSWRRACFRRYFFLNLWVVAICACDALRWAVLHAYGFSSPQYSHTYQLSDALLSLLAYLVILGMFEIPFQTSSLLGPIRLVLFLVFLLVAGLSYVFISHSVSHFYSRLAAEFQRNMYFTMIVLVALLWACLGQLQVNSRRLRLLIIGMGISASLHAAGFALMNSLPIELYVALGPVWQHLSPVATTTTFSLWAYAFLRVPEEAALPAPEPVLEPHLAEAEGGD